MMRGSDPDWSATLAPGERLLWQSRPAPVLRLNRRAVLRLLLALFFVVNGWLWLRFGMWLGFAFLAAALWLVAEVTIAPLIRHRVTAYGLTNHRALILTQWPVLGARVRAWPISADTIVTADESLPLGHVSFGFTPLFLARARMRAVGFDHIADAAAVHALIRRIQRGQA